MKTNSTISPRTASPCGGLRGRGKHLIVAGAGGNIGSHLVPLVARLPNVVRLTLVDSDGYFEENLRSQAITSSDIGRTKACAQARRARQINPTLDVVPIVDRLENVPLGCLRGDVILGCLDSRESRRYANEIAWRLGMTWIDAGVEPSLMLARVNVYVPAADQPCLECAWSERDYAKLSTVHPCDAGSSKTPATNAPACLGALAAALQAIECQKIISGQAAAALIGRQVVIEASTHRQYVTAFHRNPACRFDHAVWKIFRFGQPLQALSIGSILKVPRRSRVSTALAFGGRTLVKRLDCPGCGFSRRVFGLQHRLRQQERLCDRCGREMIAAGFHMKSQLSFADLGPGDADRSLASLGLRAGEYHFLEERRKREILPTGRRIVPTLPNENFHLPEALMKDQIHEAFLRRQYEDGMGLANSSDVLDLTPLPGGEPPCRYIAHFEGRRGLVRDPSGRIVEFQKFMVGIWFPEDYLRRVNIPQVLTYLGPHPEPWHPNIRPPFLCAHIEPGTALVDILYACHEIWTWNLFATGDEGLNHEASQWSRKQARSRFPIDRRPLKLRVPEIAVAPPQGKETA